MSFSTSFTIINIIVAVLKMVGGVGTCIHLGKVLLGFITIAFEFKLPPMMVLLASFMFSFWGRGLFYFFFGLITINYSTLTLGPGITIAGFGFFYMIFHFTKIVPPHNMRKGSYEAALGHSLGHSLDHQVNNTHPSYPQPPTGFPQNHKPHPEPATNPEYPPTDYAKAGAA